MRLGLLSQAYRTSFDLLPDPCLAGAITTCPIGEQRSDLPWRIAGGCSKIGVESCHDRSEVAFVIAQERFPRAISLQPVEIQNPHFGRHDRAAPALTRGEGRRGWFAAGLLLAIGGVFFFSLRPIFIKLAYAHVTDPVTLLALRMVFSVPFFIAAAVWVRSGSEHRPLSGREFGAVVGLGILSYYGASFLDFLALQYIPAGLGRLLLFSYPTIVVVLSALMLGKRVTAREIMALVLTYAGLMLVFAHALDGEQKNFWLGAGLAFAGSVCYALYLVAGAEVITRVGSVRFTAYAMTAASIACVLQFLLLRPASALDLPAPVYGYAVAMAVLSTAVPVFMTSEALRRVGANTVAIIGALGPVTTIVLGYLGLEEIMTPLQLAGSALVLVGVVVISLRPSSTKA
jgi:drug/metabolite transporter (DMT)-like permease